MVALDEDALICDLAETYGVYDYRALPLQTVATLGLGLSYNSRIKQRMAGITVPFDTFLLAQVVDNLSLLCWLNSEDGAKNRNRPPLISARLRVVEDKDTGRYADPTDFELARMRLLISSKEGE